MRAVGPRLRSAIIRSTRTALVRCVATADNIRGPFYREGAPFRIDLAEPDEPGERLTVAGRVIGLPDCEPLDDAVLDVWQTNARGFYSNMLGIGLGSARQRFRLRGKTGRSMRVVIGSRRSSPATIRSGCSHGRGTSTSSSAIPAMRR